jgi:hypothetical protein
MPDAPLKHTEFSVNLQMALLQWALLELLKDRK